jgi:hypothetical protein
MRVCVNRHTRADSHDPRMHACTRRRTTRGVCARIRTWPNWARTGTAEAAQCTGMHAHARGARHVRARLQTPVQCTPTHACLPMCMRLVRVQPRHTAASVALRSMRIRIACAHAMHKHTSTFMPRPHANAEMLWCICMRMTVCVRMHTCTPCPMSTRTRPACICLHAYEHAR